jgi:hypothetical protein
LTELTLRNANVHKIYSETIETAQGLIKTITDRPSSLPTSVSSEQQIRKYKKKHLFNFHLYTSFGASPSNTTPQQTFQKRNFSNK